MANLNKVFLMGNLTADPELRYTPKGTAVTDIRLAINRYYAGDNSERQEETTFVDVTLWNRQAEVAGNYLSKGRGVFVEGRLQLDSWEDKASGQKRTKLRVIGENIQLFPRGGEGDMGGAPRQQYQNAPRSNNYGQSRPAQNYNPPPMPPTNQPSNDFGDMDDEIPFLTQIPPFPFTGRLSSGSGGLFTSSSPNGMAAPCHEKKKWYNPIPGNGGKAWEQPDKRENLTVHFSLAKSVRPGILAAYENSRYWKRWT